MEDTKASLMLSRQMNMIKGTNEGQNFSELPPPPPASQIYKHLQEKFRENLQFVTRANEILKAESMGVTHYGIQMGRILEVLEENSIQLESHEIDYIKRRFSNHRHEISFDDVINACNVGRPIDHAEPELMIDTIPQPFKMIVEIFEEEIFDVAWFEIIRRHRDIEVDSNGKPLFVPKNRNLEVHAAPDVLHSSKPSAIVSMMGAPAGGVSFAVTSKGAVLTLQSDTGKLMNSIAAFGNHGPEEFESEEGKDKTESENKQEEEETDKSHNSCTYLIASVCGPHTVDGLFRVVVVRSEDKLEPPLQEEVAVAKGKKGAAPEPEQIFKPHVEAKISVIEIKISTQSSSDTRVSSYVAFYTSTLESDGMQKIATDLSPDGQVLTVNHGNSISIYTMEKSKAAIDRLKDRKMNKLTGITEDVELDALGDAAFPEIVHLNDPEIRFSPSLFLQSVSVIDHESTSDGENNDQTTGGNGYRSTKLLKDVNILKAFFFPLKNLGDEKRITRQKNVIENLGVENKPSEGNNAGGESEIVSTPVQYDPASMGIAVVYEGIEEFSLFSFSPIKPEEKKIEEVPDPKAKKGKEPELEVAPTCVHRLAAVSRLSQRLACDVSCVYVDSGRCSLFLGLRDGSVICFDILTKTMPALLGRHATAVTALNMVTWNIPSYGFQKSRSCLVLVAGAMDGSLSFYQMIIPRMPSSNDGGIHRTAGTSTAKTTSKSKRREVDPVGPFSKCLTGKFLSFRRDTTFPVLSLLTIPGHPLFLVYTLDGTLAAYTADTLDITSSFEDQKQQTTMETGDKNVKEELLGRIVMAIGMEARQNPSSLASSACLQPLLGISLQEGIERLSADNSSKWRVARFLPPPLEAIQKLRHLTPTTAISSNGILNVFLREMPDKDETSTPILTAHSLSSVLRTLCVGLSVCCREKPDLPAPALFTTMTYEERIDADMTVSRIKFFRQQLEPSKSSNEPSVSDSRMGSSVSATNNSRSESSAKMSTVGSAVGTPSNIRRKSSGNRKSMLNEANLKELQAQIDPITEYFREMKVAIPTVSEACTSRVVESSQVVVNAIEESKKARAGRGIKMLNSLQRLPNLF